MRYALHATLCLTLGAALHAQPPTLTGVWEVAAEAASGTTENGGTWSTVAVNGSLTLTQKGTGLSGSWKGRMPEPWSVIGKVTGDKYEAETEWRDVSVMRDGKQSMERARWIFRGTMSGDTTSGTLTFELENGLTRAQPFSAKRTP